MVPRTRAPTLDLTAKAAATGPLLGSEGPSAPEAGAGLSSLSSGRAYFDTLAQLIADVADALEHAHQQGVIHRDIKPSNLLLSVSGRLSVNDFGLARLLEKPGMTVTGEFVGTPRYMSPEQITAGRIPMDQRTDIYSLGATLYELLTFQPPFTGAGRDQVLAQICKRAKTAAAGESPRTDRPGNDLSEGIGKRSGSALSDGPRDGRRLAPVREAFRHSGPQSRTAGTPGQMGTSPSGRDRDRGVRGACGSPGQLLRLPRLG